MGVIQDKKHAADFILEKHGVKNEAREPTPRDPRTAPQREAERVQLEQIKRKYRRKFRSKIDPQNRTNWKRPEPEEPADGDQAGSSFSPPQ